jgi:hypothetical protein
MKSNDVAFIFEKDETMVMTFELAIGLGFLLLRCGGLGTPGKRSHPEEDQKYDQSS